jgi:lipoprotein Spr
MAGKNIIPALLLLVSLSSCSTFRPLNFTSQKKLPAAEASPGSARFLETISVTAAPITDKTQVRTETGVLLAPKTGAAPVLTPASGNIPSGADRLFGPRTAAVEAASAVELKYALLLDTEIESLPSKPLLNAVDEWYGVRYRTGGNSKTGVDCSGFTVAVYTAVFGITLPRVSRDQYRTARKISTTELQEGDLVFFNTTGRGVSHVGVYLGNNRFIHASVSRGVMVNSLFEPYYLKRFVGAGRIDEKPSLLISGF